MMISEKDTYGLITAIDYMHDYVNLVGIYYEWHSLVFRALSLLGRKPATTELFKYISGKIEARRRQPDPHIGPDFLSKLLKLEHEGKIVAEDVFGTFANNVIAGSDTTGISLGGLIYQIYEHPRVLAKLRDELEQHESRGEISNPIRFSESQKLEYLQAVIKEGLRIHPAVGKQLARTVPQGGRIIEGRFFPEGVSLVPLLEVRCLP
jgi:cytochrome P450